MSSYIDNEPERQSTGKHNSQTDNYQSTVSAESPAKETHPLSDSQTIDNVAFHLDAIMQTLDLKPEQETTYQTSERLAKHFIHDLFRGLNPVHKPAIPLLKSESQPENMIFERNMSFRSYCRRNFVPFTGKAHIAYFPKKHSIDSNGLTDMIDFLARKPHTQERLTEEIAVKLARQIGTEDIAVIVEAEHLGIDDAKTSGSTNSSVTSSYKGCFKQQQHKEEFLFSVQNQ